ncbi:MAG: response regulator [Candidatus Ozemobacteraceae bacterium]
MSLFGRVIGRLRSVSNGIFGSGKRDFPSPTVLFVDSEPNIIEGHKRMIHSLRPDWKAHFAEDASSAMAVLMHNPVDVVITELNIPCRDGTDLIGGVQKLFPHIVRMILSSESDVRSETVLQATQSAHQFLVKPCKAENLLEHIEHAMELRYLLKTPELMKIIGGMPYLPSLPPLYFKLVAALSSPNTSVSDIGDIISKDVSMTGRVLHLVNSAFFGLPRKITSPREAATLLGINTLKSLVLYVKLFFAAPESTIPGLSLEELWAHSSLAGRIAQEIVKSEGGNRLVMEEAMLGGMMHDVGKLLILEEKSYLNRVIRKLGAEVSFDDAEYQEFSTSHAEIGAYLLGIWGIPDIIVAAVACHHRPMQITQTGFSVVTAVYVANAILHAGLDKPLVIDDEYLDHIGVFGRLNTWKQIANTILEDAKEKAAQRTMANIP